jgi:hypothetical protein
MMDFARHLMETRPNIFYGIFGFLIGWLAIGAIMLLLALFDKHQRKNNENRKNALDLIGECVSYRIGNAQFEGVVASVDFDMDFTNDELNVSIYIDVDGWDEYVKADYKELNKTLFLKGGE